MPEEPAGRWIALFRAINVGGRGMIAMSDLRAMAEGLGLASPRTVLQTGNLVFDAPAGEATALETTLEAGVAKLGVTSDVMVRSSADFAAMLAANPFSAEIREDPSHLVVLALKQSASPGAEAALAAAIRGRERVVVAGQAAYITYPDGIGRSKLTMQVLERHLGTRATGRNWRTIEKIAARRGVRAGLSAPSFLGRTTPVQER